MSNLRQSSITEPLQPVHNPSEHKDCSCLTIPNTIGPLAFLSAVAGGGIAWFGISNLWEAARGELQIEIRLDPVILKFNNPDFDGGLTNSLPIWYAASVTGIVSGLIQMLTSLVFLAKICIREELDYLTKFWMLFQMIVSFVLLIIVGGVFIAGFNPNWMILSFGIDFILIHVFMLITIPIIRKEGKQIGPGEMRLHGIGGGNKMSSVFSAFLLL